MKKFDRRKNYKKNNSPSVKNNIEQTGSNQIHLTKISVKITLKYSEVINFR